MMAEHIFNDGDASFSYLQTGKGKARLLFIPGLCGAKEFWSAQLDFFSPHFEVMAVDMLGHGASSPIAGAKLVSASATAIENFLRQLLPLPTVVVGHSVGGMVLHELIAAQVPIAGAVFVDSPCLHAQSQVRSYHDWKAAILGAPDRMQLIREWFTSLTSASCPTLIRDQIVGGALKFSAEWLADFMGAVAVPVSVQTSVPVLVMEGEQYYPKGNSLSWLERYPRAEHWKYPGLGHFFFMEEPESTNRAIQSFIESKCKI